MVGGAEERERILQDSVDGRELVAAASQSLPWRSPSGRGLPWCGCWSWQAGAGFYRLAEPLLPQTGAGCRNPGDPRTWNPGIHTAGGCSESDLARLARKSSRPGVNHELFRPARGGAGSARVKKCRPRSGISEALGWSRRRGKIYVRGAGRPCHGPPGASQDRSSEGIGFSGTRERTQRSVSGGKGFRAIRINR